MPDTEDRKLRLLAYRVTNYRSVVDSGWINAEQVTALIGVNESGKTNLLLPLWKLNPAREGEIVPTSDYPKGIYAQIKENPGAYTFIEARFDAEAVSSELAELTGLTPDIVSIFTASRNFAGSLSFGFPKWKAREFVQGSEISGRLDECLTQVATARELSKETGLKEKVTTTLEAVRKDCSAGADLRVLQSVAESLTRALPDAPAATSSIAPIVQQLIEDFRRWESEITASNPADSDAVQKVLQSILPRFVYYSNYGNLDSEIYLPHVVQDLERSDLGTKEAAKARTLRVLFRFVRLTPADILELGRDFRSDQRRPTPEEIEAIADKKRERTILLNSAGTDLTKKFREWWKQGDYVFEFQADGDHFRIWVSDNRRPEKIELEDRSAGLQWFLSFYLTFLVESQEGHKNAILLLDEPGLSLHPLAQRDLSNFFEGLAGTNQIVFTTHSPFLVDADMLDRVRKVYVSEDGSTKASDDLRRGSTDAKKAGATYAIYSALNMSIAESLLQGCTPIIVEGPSDQIYLSAVKVALIAAGRIAPQREIVFPPAHGAANAKVIASVLGGRDETLPAVLLDGDPAGVKTALDLKNGLYVGHKEKVFSVGQFIEFEDAEVEDLFRGDLIAAAVDRWQRTADEPFSSRYNADAPVVPQIKSWAREQGIVLADDWKVALARVMKDHVLRNVSRLDAAVLDRWTDALTALGVARRA